MKRKTLTAAALLLSTFIIASPLLARSQEEGWPQWRGPNGLGISHNTNWDPTALNDGPKILWQANIGVGYSNVAIKQNRLYATGKKGAAVVISCLDAATGEEIWTYSHPMPLPANSTPALADNDLYVLIDNGVLLSLDVRHGRLSWKSDLVSGDNARLTDYGFATSPVVSGDLILLNINLSGVAASRKSGEVVWQSERYSPLNPKPSEDIGGYPTPVVFSYEQVRGVLFYNGKGLNAVDLHSGDVLFRFIRVGNVCTDPIIKGSEVVVSAMTKNSGVVKLDISNSIAPDLWNASSITCGLSNPVFVDGYLYGSNGWESSGRVGADSLRCVDWESGSLVWKTEMDFATLICVGGKLIILEEHGKLRIAEATPEGYKEISSGDLFQGKKTMTQFWTPPAFYEGKIYCRNMPGELFCIDVRNND